MFKKCQISKLVLTIILLTVLITPTVSVSARSYKKHGYIQKHFISKNIIRFEEKIILDIPPEYGMELPRGAYYKVNVYGIDVGDGIVLIDCGDQDYVKKLYRTVRMTFRKPVIAFVLQYRVYVVMGFLPNIPFMVRLTLD